MNKDKFNLIWSKLVNRETITYIIAGVLTTIVNFISYYVFCNLLGIENLFANVIAWIIAVIFAYVINYVWVFRSKKGEKKQELEKVSKFFGARLFSLGVEELGLYVFVNILNWNNLIVKASLAVIVIILNYFFSKVFIFNEKKLA
ncbi:MAG: GtrA family protein [Anaerocolumna sp.]|jgi:putative flippase GtrA|nr:GtrA family protein [Anaerocolumna sp.]